MSRGALEVEIWRLVHQQHNRSDFRVSLADMGEDDLADRLDYIHREELPESFSFRERGINDREQRDAQP